MKVTFPGQARQYWFDRNPTTGPSISGVLDATAPHALTSRGSYTVPANRKAMIMLVAGAMHRGTAATASGRARIAVDVNGARITKFLDNIAQGATADMQFGPQAMLPAGAVINVYTDDLSTGGAIDYHFWLGGVEFDA